jgi:hypothetical protein
MTCFRCGRREWALADRPVCSLCGHEAEYEEPSTFTLETRTISKTISEIWEQAQTAAGRNL